MADNEHANVIDSYASVQALRRIKGEADNPVVRHKDGPRLPASSKSSAHTEIFGGKAKIGSTAVPTKYEIDCFECGYAFTMTGRVYDTICPKCHKPLDMKDVELTGEWTEHIKTIGTVRITETGAIKDHTVHARIIQLAGDASTARLHCQQVELYDGARLDLTKCSFKNIIIQKEANVTFRENVACRNMDIHGHIHAKIYASEKTLLRAGGFLHGELHTPTFVVEEGAGLKAELRVGGESQRLSEQDTLNIKD